MIVFRNGNLKYKVTFKVLGFLEQRASFRTRGKFYAFKIKQCSSTYH